MLAGGRGVPIRLAAPPAASHPAVSHPAVSYSPPPPPAHGGSVIAQAMAQARQAPARHQAPSRHPAAATFYPGTRFGYGTPAVERGVTGKELLFQLNRLFGPGPVLPFPTGGEEPHFRPPGSIPRAVGAVPEGLQLGPPAGPHLMREGPEGPELYERQV